MGVTLHGAIERWYPPEPEHHLLAAWQTWISEIHFGKDYELSACLADAGALDGWPADASITEYDRERAFIECGLQWLTAAQFCQAVGLCEEPRELRDSIVALLQSLNGATRDNVRLLFWRQ